MPSHTALMDAYDTFCKKYNLTPATFTKYWTARFLQEEMLPKGNFCWQTRTWKDLGYVCDGLDLIPIPEPLRRTYIDATMSFSQLLEEFKQKQMHNHIVAICTAIDWKDVVQKRYVLVERDSGGFIRYNGRSIPVAKIVLEAAKASAKDETLKYAARDLNDALFDELMNRGVSELTLASIFGRWNAKRSGVTTQNRLFFNKVITQE